MIDVTIHVNGVPRRVIGDQSLAVALLKLDIDTFRSDSAGQGRGPVCGMGTCFECRVEIDGLAGRRACLEPVRDGMRVETAG